MSLSQLEGVIEILTGRERPENPTVEEWREGFEGMARLVGSPTSASVVDVDAGGVPSEMAIADGATSATATLYLHGGGYVIGSPRTHRELAKRLSAATGGAVLTPDYRLAPENPFPAAVEDAVSAYEWLLDQGRAPETLAIAGDSAGGGLTIAALISLRDRWLPMPSCAVCLSPWADMEGVGESMSGKAAVDPISQRDGLLALAAAYLAGANPRDPLAAPIYGDLSGLPPLLIQVGTRETLYDDAVRLANRANQAEVPTRFEPWREMIHVWHMFAPMLDEGQQAIEGVGAFIRENQGR